MDNLDDSENNAKISDSAYSNSCSNSQSRRSHSSKSTHSGSNSSGSSGYGGQPSTSGSSNQPPEKRIKEKDTKKEKQAQIETEIAQVTTECRPPDPLPAQETPEEEEHNVDKTPSPALSNIDKGPESMDISSPDTEGKEEAMSCNLAVGNSCVNLVSRSPPANCSEGFSCVISMQDGVVMYTTLSLTTTLGFPKDMWIGRSFIDFVHPRDRNTFASQITSGLPIPKGEIGTPEKVQTPGNSVSTMVCRIRRYRGLNAGFGVKERVVSFMPFLLKLTFKNVNDVEGELVYLVIQATPFFSAFKVPNEIAVKPLPFVMRHAANGNLEYIDPESVPYLGYLPQDVIGENVLKLYHPDDLFYLRQVYETIVKEGGVPRSKPYRMMVQNGHYIKLETEWSSFINPWSRKLELVTAKHHILEGPSNPDVFQSPETEKPQKIPEDERNKQQMLRDNIIKIMNETLTKPAEVAKQQMSKRCQDLASFMESLMEEQPKVDDELRLELQDADHSYYGDYKQLHSAKAVDTYANNHQNAFDGSRIYNERDSMLGGISPHHDYSDSKSSTETPLSYNQLNYNENLQRYFDSHQPFSYEDYNTVTGENILGLKDNKQYYTNCLSPMAQYSGDSGEMTSSGESGLIVRGNSPVPPLGDYQRIRLTESLLNKHNTEMEKELLRLHRGTRSGSKGEREKSSNEKRQKKMEHLARCNATFQPAAVSTTSVTPKPAAEKKQHGVKRISKQVDSEAGAHKHHCSSSRQTRRRHVTSTAPTQPSATITTTVAAATHWHPNPVGNVNNMNTYILGVGFPQQMQIMSPVMSQQVPGMPGMFPMYYAPTQATPMAGVSNMNNASSTNNAQFQPPQCMMYGHAMYGSPLMYSPIPPQVSYPMQQSMMAQTTQYSNTLNPLGLTSSNYKEACKASVPLKLTKAKGGWRDLKRGESHAAKRDYVSVDSSNSSTCTRTTNALNRSTEAVPDNVPSRNLTTMRTRMQNSDETVDRTDGESSYSSFYSSFFKTESGSAEESGDLKKGPKLRTANFWDKNLPDDQSSMEAINAYRTPKHHKKISRRKMEPPWTEQVCVTSELIYKYQVLTKSLEEVLMSDKKKMAKLTQPSMVNEQLGQLYMNLQLEGVAARLTLEEGITSSSSSGEETTTNVKKISKKKREYSKLMMIYEEDAPLPPPPTEDYIKQATSTT